MKQKLKIHGVLFESSIFPNNQPFSIVKAD